MVDFIFIDEVGITSSNLRTFIRWSRHKKALNSDSSEGNTSICKILEVKYALQQLYNNFISRRTGLGGGGGGLLVQSEIQQKFTIFIFFIIDNYAKNGGPGEV